MILIKRGNIDRLHRPSHGAQGTCRRQKKKILQMTTYRSSVFHLEKKPRKLELCKSSLPSAGDTAHEIGRYVTNRSLVRGRGDNSQTHVLYVGTYRPLLALSLLLLHRFSLHAERTPPENIQKWIQDTPVRKAIERERLKLIEFRSQLA